MSEETTSPTVVAPMDHLFSNKVYDFLKPLATVVLPGIGTLYFALATIWGLPNAEQVVGTIAAVNVFLGLLVGLGSKSYASSAAKVYDATPSTYAGSIDVTNDDGVTKFLLNVAGDPKTVITGRDQVTFKVNQL